MIRNYLLSLVVTSVIAVAAWQMIEAGETHADSKTHDHDSEFGGDADAESIAKGPHGGRWFERDGFAIELALYETGVPPEFHAYAYRQGKSLVPDDINVEVELTRLDGQVDRFAFQPLQDYLRGLGTVSEPHSFDVAITAQHTGKTYRWTYASYEGRTEIPTVLAQEAGIETELAGSNTIVETLALSGRVEIDPNRLAKVRARFDGVVQQLSRDLGEQVKRGDLLATVQSNESLQSYSVTAPIDGLILHREAQLGAATGGAALFVIADLSQLWVQLDVFSRDLNRVKPGQSVTVETLDGYRVSGTIDWVSPLTAHAGQSVQARVRVNNTDGRLRPGQFVRGRVTIAEHPVPLAVRQSAIQGFRDFQVVFARYGDTYEVRMLELGRQNREWAEVLGGLKPGTEYVTGNSYLIKADIEKSGAGHDH